MSKKSQEVEIKYKLTKSSFLAIQKKLKKIAKFIKTSKQVDEYFNAPHRNFLDHKHPYEWLRLRKTLVRVRQKDQKIAIINYKHWYPEGAKIVTHCNEYETQIDDFTQLKKILTALNFKSFITVEKEREIYTYESSLWHHFTKVMRCKQDHRVSSILDSSPVAFSSYSPSLKLRGITLAIHPARGGYSGEG